MSSEVGMRNAEKKKVRRWESEANSEVEMRNTERNRKENRSFSAFHTQYSNIPRFHYSMWFLNADGHKKRHISNEL